MGLVERVKPYIPVGVKKTVKDLLMEAKRLTDKNFREYLNHGWYRVSYGDKHPDETVMVLQRVDPTSGEYSDWISFLPYCKYAQEHGYKVIIDRKTFSPWIYQNPDKYGKENAWEYYFDQPDGLSLEEVEQGGYANVLLCRLDNSYQKGKLKYRTFWMLPDPLDGAFSDGEKQEYRQIAERYFPLTKDILRRVESDYDRLLRGKRVLGVSIRLGYTVGFQLGWGNNHPYQPSVEQAIFDAERYMKEWDCEYVFLACDATELREAFTDKFGDCILSIDRQLTNSDHMPEVAKFLQAGLPAQKGNALAKMQEGTESMTVDMVRRAEDYIVETTLLSKCTSLLCGKTGAPAAAVIMNGGAYEHIYVYRLGFYNRR